MTRLRCAASLFITGLAAAVPACQPPVPVAFAHVSEPPGFGHSTPFYRADEAGAQIVVDVAVGNNAQVVDLSKAPTSGDVALAWISNTSPGIERDYKFKPNQAATYVLYWNGAGTFRIEEDMANGQIHPKWREGHFALCDSHNSGIPDVGFKDCNRSAAGAGGASGSMPAMIKTSSIDGGFSTLFTRIFALFGRAPAPPSLDAPGWTACTDGCCSWSAT